MKTTNKKGFGLIIAMGMVILMSLLVILLLEYILPAARNVKGIENASKSYYQANIGVEDALLFLNKNSVGSSTGTNYIGNNIDTKFKVVSTGSTIPPVGQGNSDYDNDWNKISAGNPIQMEVGYNYINSFSPIGIQFYFKVPDLDLNGNPNEVLSGSTLDVINWQLSSNSDVLNSSGTLIEASEVNGGVVFFGTKTGSTLGGNISRLDSYYGSNCTGLGSGCILKLSIVNKLELDTNNTSVPYLEWKLNVDTNNVPLRYSITTAEGKSYGFKKTLEFSTPQQTVVEAFDFTVFQ